MEVLRKIEDGEIEDEIERGDEGELEIELKEELENRRRIVDGWKRVEGMGLIEGGKEKMKIEVIKKKKYIEDEKKEKWEERGDESLIVIKEKKGRGLNEDLVEKMILCEEVMRDLKWGGRGKKKRSLRKIVGGDEWKILKLIGDEVGRGGKLGKRIRVIIGGENMEIGKMWWREKGMRIKDYGLIKEERRWNGENKEKMEKEDNEDGGEGIERCIVNFINRRIRIS